MRDTVQCASPIVSAHFCAYTMRCKAHNATCRRMLSEEAATFIFVFPTSTTSCRHSWKKSQGFRLDATTDGDSVFKLQFPKIIQCIVVLFHLYLLCQAEKYYLH